MEKQLQRQHYFNTTLIQSSPTFFVAISGDGKTLMMNDSMLKALGYTAEEVEGSDYLQTFVPENEREELSRIFELLVKNKEPTINKNRVLTKDGRAVPVEWHGRPVFTSDGRLDFFFGVGIDITDRRRAEEELLFQKSLLEAQSETSPDGILVVDEHGWIISCNRRFTEMWRIPQEVIDTKSDASALQYIRNQLVIPEEFFNRVTYLYQHPEETSKDEVALTEGRVFERHSAPIHGADGRCFGRVWYFHDITERKKMEEQLRESEQMFRSIVENSHAGIYIMDNANSFIYVNDRLCAMSGYSREELIGSDFRRLIAEESMEIVMDRYTRRLQGEEVPSWYEFVGVSKHGEKRFMETRSAVVCDSAGRTRLVGQILDVDERKKAEAALRESEERFFKAFHATPAAMVISDLETGRYIDVNEQALRSLKFTREEMIGHTSNELGIWEDPEVRTRAVTKLQNEGSFREFPVRFITKYGDILDVLWSAELITLGAKKVMLSLLFDVTERKRSEEALLLSETRYRTLFETANDAIMILNANSLVIVDCNAMTLKMFGYPRDQIIGRDPLFFSPDKQPDGCSSKEKAFERGKEALYGKVTSFDWLHQRQDGTRFYTEVSLNSLEVFDEKFLLAVVRDVTERKTAEKEIREAQNYLQTLIENSRDGILITDAVGNILSINKAGEHLYGFDRKDMIGRHASMFTDMNKELRKMIRERTFELFEKGFTVFETVNRTKDGKILDIECSSALVKDEEGNPVAAISIMRDITDRKKMEYQLRQAQKMEAIGTLAGGIAHDFNNILGAIFGYTELSIARLTDRPEICSYLNEIFKAADRAKDLVKQILTFSRQREHEKKPVMLKDIVEEAVKLLRASLPTTIELRRNLASSSIVLADPTQVHQIVMNLCTNASHAMSEQGGVLEISLDDVDFDEHFGGRYPVGIAGRYVRLRVADTGCGIRPENLERIFDPFFTTKKEGEGTGMGLSVVHGIVKSHGGEITVSSEPGRGSLFTIYLPIVQIGIRPEAVEQALPPTGTERILFVDDEPALADIARQMLASLGYHVTICTDSTEALEKFSGMPESYDMVITDFTMPHMTGDELARRVMEIKPTLPVMLCTGYSEKITEQKASSIGIKALVMKPFKKNELGETIRKVLDGRLTKAEY